MWWNFVGRSHEEIVAFREEWQRQISATARSWRTPSRSPTAGSASSPGDHLPPIPAPALPNARLKGPAADPVIATGRQANRCHGPGGQANWAATGPDVMRTGYARGPHDVTGARGARRRADRGGRRGAAALDRAMSGP